MPTAIVTGAGSGIGRVSALMLAQSGFSVVLVGRRREALEETAEFADGETLVFPADVSKEDDCRAVVDGAIGAFDEAGLAVLVNNAGVGRVVPVDAMTPAVWAEAMATNASSTAWLTMFAWPHLVTAAAAGHRPAIVNIASMAVLDPFPGFFAYAASKAAVSLMTLSCAKEGADKGIRAFCLAPGAVETPLLRSAFDEKFVPKDAALGPDEVARVVMAAVQGELDDANGKTIPVVHPSVQPWLAEWKRENPAGWLAV